MYSLEEVFPKFLKNKLKAYIKIWQLEKLDFSKLEDLNQIKFFLQYLTWRPESYEQINEVERFYKKLNEIIEIENIKSVKNCMAL